MSKVLIVQDLHVSLKRQRVITEVLKGINLEISKGEILALVGESGSGKSTLGLSLGGLVPIESVAAMRGSIKLTEVEIQNLDAISLTKMRKTSIRYIFQDPITSLNPTMKIGRQITEATTGEVDVNDWLRKVGISAPAACANSYPHELSGGQRQRVMIAIAMVSSPALVVADEPTSALDVTVQKTILTLIKDLSVEMNTAFLLITHDFRVALEVANNVAVLYQGKIVETGPIRSVLAKSCHPYTEALYSARLSLTQNRDLTLNPSEIDRKVGSENSACAYACSCHLVLDKCLIDVPELKVASNGGKSACWRSDEVGMVKIETSELKKLQRITEKKQFPVAHLVNANRTFSRRRKSGLVQALLNVNFEISKNECVAIVGESGSGKTTLLRVIAGLEKLDSGSIERFETTTQMIFQDPGSSLTPWMSVREIVGERLRKSGLEKKDRDEKVLETLIRVGLNGEHLDCKPRQLSGGQQQRVAIARAIIDPPELILADEPISSLDAALASSIIDLLLDLKNLFNFSLLFVTHDISAARYISDRILVMKAGQILEDGHPEQIVKSPTHSYTKELLSSVPGQMINDR